MARWTLTGGQVHDSGQAVPLLEGLKPDAVVADKAYDADALVEHIEESGAAAVIPPRTNRLEQRSFDKHQYKHRNLIERFFLRIKHFCRIAIRYNKLAERFSAFTGTLHSLFFSFLIQPVMLTLVALAAAFPYFFPARFVEQRPG